MTTEDASCTPPGQPLAQEHQQIDAAVDAAIDGRIGHADLAAAMLALRRHIHLEESVLFPPLREAGMQMEIGVMNMEHGEMWPMLRAVEAACRQGEDLRAVRMTLRNLKRHLRVHNLKEEEVVYAAADRLAAGEHGRPYLDAIAGADMPEDWTCEQAGH